MGNPQKLGNFVNALFQDASNNVGIGGSPSGTYKLEVTGTAKVSSTLLVSGAATFSDGVTSASFFNVLKNGSDSGFSGPYIAVSNAANNVTWGWQLGASNQLALFSYASSTIKNPLNINITGNVGIAVTPSSWSSSFKALQVGTASLSQNNNTTAYIGSNWVSESGGDKYITTNAAAIYAQNTGAHIWYTAPSGTAGDAMTFTERMRITSGGDVGIGQAPSDASFRLVIKGADTTAGKFAIYCYNSGGVDLFGVRNDGAFYTGTAVNSPYNLTSGSAANCFINTNGFLYRSTSSLKYKKNVQDYTKGLAEVLQLRPVSYESINEEEAGNIYAGLIAEEIHDLGLTEFVQYRTDGTPDALAYANMIALLTKAIQEQNQTIQNLQAQNQDLKSRLDKAGI